MEYCNMERFEELSCGLALKHYAFNYPRDVWVHLFRRDLL